jgi:KDO2-lipid IV(A) lauroyltransferase
LRYRLEFVLYRLFGWLIRLMPMEAASAMTGALFRWFAPLSNRHQRVMNQLSLAYPHMSAEEHVSIAIQSWETMGRVLAESFRLEEILNSDRVIVEDLDTVQARLAQCQGFIACTAHQGNWEIAVVPLTKMGIKTAGIYQRLKNPFVDAMVRQQRAMLYPDGLFQKQHSTALAATKYVKAGGALSVMADLREHRGVKVPFFGQPAPSNPFPAMIAVSLNKPIFIAHVMREKGVRFKIRVSEIEVMRSGDRDADILETTTRIQAALEQNIRERPHEWMWSIGRWM